MGGGMKRVVGLLAVALLAAGVALAQDNQGGGQRGGGQRGGRFNMAQFRQRMMEDLKTQLAATDEEWKALEPLIDKAMTLSRETASGGMRMAVMGRRGRPGGGQGGPGGEGAQGAQTMSATMTAATALQKTLDNKQAAPAEIKAKLTAFREAREKAKQELAKTRDSLRELVTPRQEAYLVLIGVLD